MNEVREHSRAKFINSVRKPLALLTLALLAVQGVLGGIVSMVGNDENLLILIIAMSAVFFLAIVVAVVIILRAPGALDEPKGLLFKLEKKKEISKQIHALEGKLTRTKADLLQKVMGSRSIDEKDKKQLIRILMKLSVEGLARCSPPTPTEYIEDEQKKREEEKPSSATKHESKLDDYKELLRTAKITISQMEAVLDKIADDKGQDEDKKELSSSWRELEQVEHTMQAVLDKIANDRREDKGKKELSLSQKELEQMEYFIETEKIDVSDTKSDPVK